MFLSSGKSKKKMEGPRPSSPAHAARTTHSTLVGHRETLPKAKGALPSKQTSTVVSRPTNQPNLPHSTAPSEKIMWDDTCCRRVGTYELKGGVTKTANHDTSGLTTNDCYFVMGNMTNWLLPLADL